MATLQKIRSKGTALILILGLALFAFIAEEFVRALSSSQNANRQVIGKVYGENVNYQEFNELYEEYENAVKLSNGNQNLTEAQSIQLHDQVWNDYVNQKLIEHEAKALGLSVTDAELQNIINTGSSQTLRQTPFVNQQTGAFDVNTLKQFLSNYEEIQNNPDYPAAQKEALESYYKYWKFIEKQVRQEALAQKYQALLSACLLSNPASAKAAFEARNNEATVLLAAVPYTTVKDTDVEPTEQELKNKYNEMKQQYPDFFDMQQEARDIKYIVVPVTASQADEDALRQELAEAAKALDSEENLTNVVRENRSMVNYNGLPVSRKALPTDIANQLDSLAPGAVVGPTKNVAENTLNVIKYIAKVQQPDSVEYRMIAVQGADDKAKKTADSIYAALQAGAPIDTIAKQHNQEAAAQWVTSAQVDNSTVREEDKKFIETLFTTPAGSIKKLDLAGGSFIIKVTDRRNVIDKYDVAIIKRSIDFSNATHNDIWNKFSSFLAANSKQADIEANAAKEGYAVQTAQYITSNDHYIANQSSTTDALRWVFNKSTKVGDVSELYEAGNAHDQLLVVMLTAIHKKGVRDFKDENLQNILKQEVIKDKKAAQIIEKMQSAKSVADVAKMGGAVQDTVSHITFASPVFVQKVASSEPILSGTVAAAKKGQFVNAVKGEGSVYAFQVLEQNKLDGKFDQKQEETQQAATYTRSLGGLIQVLARKAKIVDNRYLFYQ
ncbi:MAG: SurA N-terminal domain-containing protein [Bacteroidaceae bacterium]|nr:SurA N-terminal domain-containing protein [Bacteroidaceae bacterium]